MIYPQRRISGRNILRRPGLPRAPRGALGGGRRGAAGADPESVHVLQRGDGEGAGRHAGGGHRVRREQRVPERRAHGRGPARRRGAILLDGPG